MDCIKMNNNTNIYSHIPTSTDTLCKIRRVLPSYITDSRLNHTLSVEKEALCLSDIFFPVLNIHEKYKNDISCACLVHDLTKNLSLENQQSLCNKYNISVDSLCFNSCALLHSKTSAFEAKRLFDVNDYVFNAVFYHTTGKPDMNIFEKIVFISDYIEPTRTHKNCIDTRKFLYDNINLRQDKLSLLDEVIIMSIDKTVSYLLKTKTSIDLQTVIARNYIIENTNN